MAMPSGTFSVCLILIGVFVANLSPVPAAKSSDLPTVSGVEFQPFASSTRRVLEALDYVGAALPETEAAGVEAALRSATSSEALEDIQNILDRHCLAMVVINPESRVKVEEGPAPKELVQDGWRTFLVKVHNQAGVTAELKPEGRQIKPLQIRSTGKPDPDKVIEDYELRERFLDVVPFTDRPMKKQLSGLELEYRIFQLYSRDAGKREAVLGFNVGQGTQDIGFRNEVPILFNCLPSVEVTLRVLDVDATPGWGQFVIKDQSGRVCPAPAKRLAPDFFFHHQIYRKDGETVNLAPGKYSVESSRGPEYLVKKRTLVVPHARSHEETFELERWIHVAKQGWQSGDHHIHAAGCSHYDAPTKGVTPADMWRHVLGEDLNVGCVLTWGPCWYHQKQFFQGRVHELSTANHVMRYDVEVSGFPSSHAGHLSLIRLVEDDYNGLDSIDEWPSWDLPVLQWAKAQGAVAGFSHSGWGLEVDDDELPSYKMPPFDGIGANEYIVDVVHGAVDFISAVDTPIIWELSIWYHTLNCGFRARISGETDFPCIYGERVGLGRSYVRMPEGPIDYDLWANGIRDGRSYVSDGKTHLLDFSVNGLGVGEKGPEGATSEIRLAASSAVTVKARVAAYLNEAADPEIQALELDQKPYWDVERARIEGTRKVPLEVVVNSVVMATREIEADGKIVDASFEVPIQDSGWVALRVFPSAHTNPIFVTVADRPIRADVESAEWCLEAVDVCWREKSEAIRESERDEAEKAYDAAREEYRKILAEAKARRVKPSEPRP
ncbi:MAG: hypothetical protein GHCLOJNM_01514 [bacterium]|nr:hypothetical protein [bacterium]